jgi:hypothetical protein
LQVLRSNTARKGFEPDRLDKIPVEIEWALPRIGVNLVGMSYGSERHIGKQSRVIEYTDNWATSASAPQGNVYAPVPYNLEIELTAIARNLNDIMQITEQIIPFFTPSLSLNIKVFQDKVSESVPVVLTGVAPDIEEDFSEADERVFRCVFNFTMKVNYYLPKRLDKVITKVETNIGDDVTNHNFNQYIQRAELDGPEGTYPEVIDITVNPVVTEMYSVNNRGLEVSNPNPPYAVGDVVFRSDTGGTPVKMRLTSFDASGAPVWEI